MTRTGQDREKVALVCEFSGSPRSGKSSTIDTLCARLRDRGLTVQIVPEGIRESGLRGAGLVPLNTAAWLGKMAQIVVLRHSSDADLVIVDRGVFDAYATTFLLAAEGLLAADQARAWRRLLLVQLELVGRVFLLVSHPGVSLERDGWCPGRDGPVMNARTLGRWRAIYDQALARIGRQAPDLAARILRLDTSQLSAACVLDLVATQIEYDMAMSGVEQALGPRGDAQRTEQHHSVAA